MKLSLFGMEQQCGTKFTNMFGGTNYYCEAQTNTYRKQRKINRVAQRKMMKNIDQTSNEIDNISQRLNPGVEEKLPFPNLILYYGSAKFNRSFYFLKLSFDQANYPLQVEVTKLAGEFNVRLMSGGLIISQAKGMTLKVAKQCAVVDAMKRLQCTNYAIEVKQNYFNPKKYPDFLQYIDPSLSHVYKVVYLKKSVDEGPVFPHRLTGAVDYVFDELELSSYIKDHCKSASNADLYVLNINKALRQWLRKMGTINGGWQHRNVTNCSDRGSCLEPPLNIRRIFTDLQECGGETIKHLLIPPGSENIVTFEEKMCLEGSQQSITPKARCQFGEQQIPQKVHDVCDNQARKVIIDPWICKHLIIVEFMTENNQLGTAKELIFQAVKQCPMLEEFIVEKTRDKYSNILLAEAMIDRMVVGRSVGIQKYGVKNVACTDALENLKKNCIYIKAKNTYFGHESGPENIPDFLTGPVQQTNLYRIISPYNVRSLSECEKLFKNFRNQAIEDLFFKSFPSHEMEAMIDLARRMNLPVRIFGKDWFCVTKKINPREIFKALSNCRGENEKYKLIIPDRLETEKKQLSEKPFLNNMFGIKSERDTFQRSSGHKEIINASENFDVGNSMKSNYNATSSSISNASRSGNLVYNTEKDNVIIKKNLSNLFDVPSNITQDSRKSLSTDQLSDNIDISEHNLLKKERIVISTNSYPPEKTGNIGLSQQSDEIRKKSIYDHGDDVWLDDIEDPREVLLHVESLNQEKRACWATPFVPQQVSAEQKEDANYYHNEGRVKDYNHGRPSQYNNFSNSKSQQRLDDDHVSSGVSKRHIESTKVYDQQRYDEPPNKVARLFTSPWSTDEMRRKKDCNAASVEEDYYQENSYYPSNEPKHNLRNSNLGNLSRQAEMNNTYSQQQNNYYKENEIYPSRNKISNEPPNKVAKLAEFDPQFQGSGVQRYDNLNQQSFAQSRSLGQPCRVHDDGEMSIHKDNYHQAKSSIRGTYDRKQYSDLNDSSLGSVTRKLEEFTGSQSTIEADALSKTPDTSCVSEDRDYFSAQSKRASNHQRMSFGEFVPVKVVDYAEQNDRIIDHQNSSRAEESFYSRGSSQHSSDWKSDDRLCNNQRPQSHTSNISHPTDHSRVSSTKRSELETLSSQNRNDDIHSYTNQRSSTHVSKLFDLTDFSKESTSQYSIESRDRFSRGYSDSFNGNTSGLYNDSFNRPASTFSKSSEFRTGIPKPSTQSKHETGKLWKKNIKELFDQRKNY